MNLSGGRCFCLMLGVSLLAHGGLFLNRSPLARLSESKEAPLSLRLAVTPAPPAPTNAAESTTLLYSFSFQSWSSLYLLAYH